jgi:hypothetical protein
MDGLFKPIGHLLPRAIQRRLDMTTPPTYTESLTGPRPLRPAVCGSRVRVVRSYRLVRRQRLPLASRFDL